MATVVTFFIFEISHSIAIADALIFRASAFPHNFWAALVWPIVGIGSPWGLLCGGMWAYFFLGSLERSWGTRQVVILFASSTLISSIAVLIGSKVLAVDAHLAGLFIGCAPATIAWCSVNRRENIMLYGIFSIPAPIVAVFTIVCVWWLIGTPAIGLFALVSSGAAYWYANVGRYQFQGYKVSGRPLENLLNNQRRKLGMSIEDFDSGPNSNRLNPIARAFKNWKDARRLAKFFKDSNSDKR